MSLSDDLNGTSFIDYNRAGIDFGGSAIVILSVIALLLLGLLAALLKGDTRKRVGAAIQIAAVIAFAACVLMLIQARQELANLNDDIAEARQSAPGLEGLIEVEADAELSLVPISVGIGLLGAALAGVSGRAIAREADVIEARSRKRASKSSTRAPASATKGSQIGAQRGKMIVLVVVIVVGVTLVLAVRLNRAPPTLPETHHLTVEVAQQELACLSFSGTQIVVYNAKGTVVGRSTLPPPEEVANNGAYQARLIGDTIYVSSATLDVADSSSYSVEIVEDVVGLGYALGDSTFSTSELESNGWIARVTCG